MKGIFILSLFFLVSCRQKENRPSQFSAKESDEVIMDSPTSFPVYDFDGLKPLLHKKDNKTYIINFWATWCKPCVEELPDFEKLYGEMRHENVELILVSLDMPNMWKSKLEPFVKNRGLKGKVVILDDPKMNDWIPQIDADWQGGIPATIIYNKTKRQFYPQGFTYESLKEELSKFL